MLVPDERAYSTAMPEANARVIIVRDRSQIASWCYWGVFVEGKLAARVGNTERVDLQVRSGVLNLTAARDPMGKGLCGNMFSDLAVTKTTYLEPGATKIFRLMPLGTGGMDLVRADQ